MVPQQRLVSLKIQGYRPFRDFHAKFGSLDILVGANAAGKSSLFEFLKFLRDSLYQDIPPEIVLGSIGQQIFHVPGPEKFWWSAEIDTGQPVTLNYQGEVMGPVGRTHVAFERVQTSKPLGPQHKRSYLFMNVREREGLVEDLPGKLRREKVLLKKPNQLALSTITNPALKTLYGLREYIRDWRFYSSFNIANERIRRSVPIEQEPVLYEDGGNLSSVLHYMMTEHPQIFAEFQEHIRGAVPGFRNLTVKARGGPGEVIAFWQERGVNSDLSLADLSDGVLRFLCWAVLCLLPNPPSLICIDEPDQGVHPRTLPFLAALFEKASSRTQILLATHASYFLTQFPLTSIAVVRKDDGEAQFVKPADSKALRANLEDFGVEEVELMHRSDELERLA